SQLNEPLLSIRHIHLATHSIQLGLHDLFVHVSTLSKEPQLFLFFQIVVDQTVSSTFECVVCSIRPHRVIAAIYREENIGDVFNIQSTLRKISLACRLCGQSERIINIRLHGIDQVELNHLETANGCTHVE